MTDRVVALMEELGLAAAGDEVTVRPLTGGVSSDIALVTTPQGQFCVKFALARLKVVADWQVPVGRNAAEYDWLSYVARLDAALVPRLFGQNPTLGGFAMDYLPDATHPTWKSRLMAGQVDVRFAGAVGHALGRIHARAARDADKDGGLAARFTHQANFHALRLDPYFAATATRHPDLAGRLHALISHTHSARITLVHGDVSPKNILCGPDGPVFLDAECAVWGDPAFDPAFCINHLVIKASARIGPPDQLAAAALALWDAYLAQVDWEDRVALTARVAALLPALMLARVDGKSPVEYLDVMQQHLLRQLARDLILAAPTSPVAIITAARTAGETA